MRKLILFTISFLLFCSENPTDSNTIIKSERPIAPAFSLQSLTHGTQTLEQYKGEVVYLFFLGYNCPPCIGNAPSTQTEIYLNYNKMDVHVLGLDVWNGSFGQLANFQIQTNVSYPLLLNASSVGNEYTAYNDYSVVVDKQGKIAYKSGGVNISEIKSVMDILLSE